MKIYIVKEEYRLEDCDAEIIAVESSEQEAIARILRQLTMIYAAWRYSRFTIEEWEVGGSCTKVEIYSQEKNSELLITNGFKPE